MSIEWSKMSGWSVSALAAVWGALLLGVLQIQYVPLDAGHSVCGPWGCGPPVPPLIAYHGFWIVLLSLPTVLGCRCLSPSALQNTGWGLVAVGLSGLLIVGLWELIPSLPHWLPRIRDLAPKYYMQRYLLSLVTLVDVPIVPLTLSGLGCLLIARTKAQPTSDVGDPSSKAHV